MPIIKSSSDLQRNFKSLSELAHETREPIYITRNGEASLVVMDADAFDESQELRRLVYEHERRIYEAVVQAERDRAEGRAVPYEEVLRRREARRACDAEELVVAEAESGQRDAA